MADGKTLTELTALTKAGIDALASGLASLRLYVVDTEEAADADKGKRIAGDELQAALVRPQVEVESGTTRALVAGDDGKVILCTNASPITVTVPDGMPLGWTVTILRGHGAGALTIQGDGTILLETEGSAPGAGVTAAVNTRGVASVVVHNDTSPDTARVFGGIS